MSQRKTTFFTNKRKSDNGNNATVSKKKTVEVPTILSIVSTNVPSEVSNEVQILGSKKFGCATDLSPVDLNGNFPT